MTLPSKLKSQFPISKSRYDDFILTHQANTPYIHWNGAFLPWHRAFGHAFETALREECFYPFGLPYWETALDYANLTLSPVLQRKPLSFGGDGIGPITESPPGSGIGNCVVDGAFAGLRVTMVNGPGPAVAGDHCLKRFFDQETATYWLSPQKVDLILAENSYSKMAVTLEGDINPFDPMPLLGLHSAGHTSVGGDLGDMFTSPADPLFWLHHANLDRIWAK